MTKKETPNADSSALGVSFAQNISLEWPCE
jgi:hypothetical protein